MKRDVFALLICLFFIAGCADAKTDTARAFALDTVVDVTAYGGRSAGEYIDEIKGYEQLFSKTAEGSDISRINAAGVEEVSVSAETIEILKRCGYYYEISSGRIDPTIGGVTKLWDFHGGGSVPSEESIEKALEHVGYDKLIIGDGSVRKTDPETELDLGFIAKGYIADRLLEGADGSVLLNLGGNVSFCGEKPNKEPYRIGIEKPFSSGEPIGTVYIFGNMSFVTSGIYERYFEDNGKLYHHILDAKTGYPVENGLYAVTVVMESGTDADALSTTCFVSGLDEGMKLIEDTPGAEALFIDSDMNIHVSSGFPEYRIYAQ